MKNKNRNWIIIISIINVIVGFYCGYLLSEVQLGRQKQYLAEIVESWNGFEADYREDIKNIDKLRDDLRCLRQESDGWEKIAFEFKDEALDYKMQRNKYYTILMEHGIEWAR